MWEYNTNRIKQDQESKKTNCPSGRTKQNKTTENIKAMENKEKSTWGKIM